VLSWRRIQTEELLLFGISIGSNNNSKQTHIHHESERGAMTRGDADSQIRYKRACRTIMAMG